MHEYNAYMHTFVYTHIHTYTHVCVLMECGIWMFCRLTQNLMLADMKRLGEPQPVPRISTILVSALVPFSLLATLY